MKLGSETGSLVNHLQSRATKGQPTPTVGMGCTFLSWTDRHAGTIVSVGKPKSKRFQWVIGTKRDIARRIDSNGMSECQDYDYTRNPNAATELWGFDLHSGQWVGVAWRPELKRYVKRGAGGLHIGQRDEYHDFSF